MAIYQIFPFTDEFIEQFRQNKQIPVDFYNKDGQILIHKKEEATVEEIERLLKFMKQGIYYDLDDSSKLGLEGKSSGAPEGLSDVKLLSEQITKEMSDETTKLFDQLKSTSKTAISANRMSERMSSMFDDFQKQPDAMIGLINILELMSQGGAAYEVEMAVKRTVVAMSMKTRGMQAARNFRDAQIMKEKMNNLMMSALLCDVGYFRMEVPKDLGLNENQMNYIRNHPLMSYLMIAHEEEISKYVKYNILHHHRPKTDGITLNNYPQTKFLETKLLQLKEKYLEDPTKEVIVRDIDQQLALLKASNTTSAVNEDISILAIASEFASLTTEVPWRKAFDSVRAVQMIVNNSYFSYPYRIVREFLDHVAISLCDNKMIIKPGDYIIVATGGGDPGKSAVFELCQVLQVNRFQSRPYIRRLATIPPLIKKSPKVMIINFSVENLKPDRRKAHYDLTHDESRHIVYLIDPVHDKELHEKIIELTKEK